MPITDHRLDELCDSRDPEVREMCLMIRGLRAELIRCQQSVSTERNTADALRRELEFTIRERDLSKAAKINLGLQLERAVKRSQEDRAKLKRVTAWNRPTTT